MRQKLPDLQAARVYVSRTQNFLCIVPRDQSRSYTLPLHDVLRWCVREVLRREQRRPKP